MEVPENARLSHEFLGPVGTTGETVGGPYQQRQGGDEVSLKREDLAVVAEEDRRIERLAGVLARRYCGAREARLCSISFQ